MPTNPKATPITHVQIIFASAFTARVITPAIAQQIVPIATRVTALRSRVVMGQE